MSESDLAVGKKLLEEDFIQANPACVSAALFIRSNPAR